MVIPNLPQPTAFNIKRTQNKTTTSNLNYTEYKDDLKYEDNFQYEDNLKYKDNLKSLVKKVLGEMKREKFWVQKIWVKTFLGQKEILVQKNKSNNMLVQNLSAFKHS